jgi:flagellar motor protein MotB
MGSRLTCPVCPLKDVPSDATTCPNCGTDLEPLRRILTLPHRLVAEAITLAKGGDSDSAIEKLYGALQLGSPPNHVRSLIAGVLWRTGRRQDAVRQWHKILLVDAGDRAAARLARAGERALQQVRRRAATAKIMGSVLATAILVGLLLTTLSYRTTALRGELDAARLETALQQRQKDVTSPAQASLQPPITDLAKRLKQEGMAVLPTADGITVQFEAGLFMKGSERLTEEGLSHLAAVSRALNEQTSKYEITVEGRTDNVPVSTSGRWGSNWVLGFARAQTATEYLFRQVTNPHIRWYATSAGDSSPRFPNDTRQSRQRNRTIVLHVSRSSERPIS